MDEGLDNFEMHFNSAHDGELFAGNADALHRCPVNGDRWMPIREAGLPSFADFRAFAVAGMHLLTGTSEGIYLSSDKGGTWRAVKTRPLSARAFT